MKKALKINLSGQIFHIDEDAYEKLKLYLDAISRHFSNASESKEIMSDIESRIAELFHEKMGEKSEVITIREVDYIIGIMGQPEEIAADDTAEEEGPGRYYRKNRRLYRDPDNAVFGGVSSGLAAYFNIDTLLVRILFVVFTVLGGGVPVLIYLVLWIAVPKAVTSAQKLEMRGEKITISNIEKTVRDEYESVKGNLKKKADSESFRRTEDFFSRLFHVIGIIIVALLKIFLVFIAIIFVIAGIAMIFGTLSFAFLGVNIPFTPDHHTFLSLSQIITPFFNPTNITLLVLAITVLILIPVIAVIYGLSKLLFRFKARDKNLGMAAFALWILALISSFVLIYSESSNFRNDETIVITKPLEGIKGDTLYISMNEDLPEDWDEEEFIDFDNRWYFSKDMDEIIGMIKVDVRKSSDDNYKVQLRKYSRGYDQEQSAEMAEKILYNYTQLNDTLNLDSYFRLEEKSQWRMQKAEIILFVPEGKAVHLSRTTADFLNDVDNIENIYDKEMSGHTWIMKEEGLSWTLKR